MYNKIIPWGRISCLTLFCLLFYACDSEIDPDTGGNPGNPGGPSNPPIANQLDPDEASEHLVLANATKIMGSLPSAPDNQIKLEVEDTLFVVKGYPLGFRVETLHHPGENVAGYNLIMPGASFYYYVPETLIEGQFIPTAEEDTTSVLVLDFDPPVDEVSYPYSEEIIIQPVDENGNPLDEFNRVITVEDPENPGPNSACNTIARPVSDNTIHWEWDFTIREYNGQILNVFAPGLATPINSQGSGCCSAQGNSYSVSDNPGCVPNVNTAHMTWVELEVSDYSVRPYEWWQIYDDGSVTVYGNYINKTYNRATTNFCTEVVGYTFTNEDISGAGTHDFTPGGSYINFDWTTWTGGWRASSGEVIYTCNTMIRSWGGDDNFAAVYKRFKYPTATNPIEFYYLYKPWFD